MNSTIKSQVKDFDWILINFDGFNVGIANNFNNTYLVFDNYSDAIETIFIWNAFIRGDL